jgi:hypothetical protein
MSQRGGCWPNPEQELLLRAALGSGPEAVAAWEQWLGATPDLGGLDHGSIRLLPMLHANLRALGVSHPRMELLQGTYRKAWYQNRVLLHRVGRVIAGLNSAGVRTMVLKGVALLASLEMEIAVRPMNDGDVLVPTESVGPAARVLDELGLRTRWDLSADRLSVIHAAPFSEGGRHWLDLHWHMLKEDCTPGADAGEWASAVPVRVDGVETLAPTLTDQLLHTCVHGVRWDPEPPLRWIADATLLIRTGKIDWGILGSRARAHGVAPALALALSYLASTLGLAIPSVLIAGLADGPLPAWKRRELRLQMEPLTELRRLRLHWYRHRRLRGGEGGLGVLATFPTYLRLFWGLHSVVDVPRYLARELPEIRRRLAGGE